MRKQKTARIACRADPELYGAVLAEARRLGVTPSIVIRQKLAAAFGIPSTQGEVPA